MSPNQPLHLTRRHYGLSGFNVSPAAAQVNGSVILNMAAIDLRNNVVSLMRLLASKDEQLAYEREVPIANVPAELVCMWFDDIYHPDSDLFIEAFSLPERERLARFDTYYDARHKQLPNTLTEMHQNQAWLEVMDEAQRVLQDLGWAMGG